MNDVFLVQLFLFALVIGGQFIVVWRAGQKIRQPSDAVFFEIIYLPAMTAHSPFPPCSVGVRGDCLVVQDHFPFPVLWTPRDKVRFAEVPFSRIRSSMPCNSPLGKFVSVTFADENGEIRIVDLRLKAIDEFQARLPSGRAT